MQEKGMQQKKIMPEESEIFINRELSWLEFNRRVLELSSEAAVPLGEQLNFAAIYGSNLDEFFMIRVGSLYDQTLLKSEYKENKTNMTPKEQIDAIMPKVAELQKACDRNINLLTERLALENLRRVDFKTLDKVGENFWKKYFLRELYPVLSPIVFDRRHPFPFLRNREIYVGVLLKKGKGDKVENQTFGLIPVSAQFERLITFSDGDVLWYTLVEDLILHFAEASFGKAANVQAKCLFRVTRNADLSVEEGMFDHDIDYRSMMSELLKRRRKLAAVRVQFLHEPPAAIRELLEAKLKLPAGQAAVQETPLELSYLYKLRQLLEKSGAPGVFYPAAKPILPPADYRLYRDVQQRDVLLSYPYHSIRPFIQMLRDAAADPDVISIKMTLYRVAQDSKIIDALISAAENGKEVVTIVELRARFDEQNNIDWSRALEQAGCTVIYGFSDFKIHSKLMLITRRQGGHYRYISSIGTGNYNEKTSELYTDLALVTSDQETGEEVAAVFNDLSLGRLTEHVNKLIVAPLKFKSVLLGEIKEEIRYQNAGGNARIFVKCNSISDKTMIETLSEASMAGVPVKMLVRGICCLQAGMKGLTDNIEVRSIVGRYLEHSRIYAFGGGERLRVYIASGDFLTRNTERRVEVGIRIGDAAIRNVLCDMLDYGWRDNVNCHVMAKNNTYVKRLPEKGAESFDSQMAFYPYFEQLSQMANTAGGGALEAGHGAGAARRPAGILERLARWLGLR